MKQTNDTLLMITSYPQKGTKSVKDLNAVASYADHLLSDLVTSAALYNKKVVVLAEKLNNSINIYSDNGAQINRVWKRNNVFLYLKLLITLLKFNNAENVFIQFEFNMFGGNFHTLLFIPFIFGIKLIGRKATILFHQVTTDLGVLSGHLNIYNNFLLLNFYNLGLHFFYFLSSLFADKVIVHDDILMDRLVRTGVAKSKIFVVPHGLGEYSQAMNKDVARRQLGLSSDVKIVVCFGFMTWYKGSDWVVETFSDDPRFMHLQLIMAGGSSPNLRQKSHYKTFLNKILVKISKAKNILYTDYLSDDLVYKYLSAADLLLFPYRTQISSSGPLAIAFSLGKPFLLSSNLSGLLETFDIKELLGKNSIQNKELMFDLTSDSLFQSINNIVENLEMSNKIAHLSRLIGDVRKWSLTSERLLQIIYDDLK